MAMWGHTMGHFQCLGHVKIVDIVAYDGVGRVLGVLRVGGGGDMGPEERM